MKRLLPFIILGALQIGDLISTRLVLAAGGVELNPLVRAFGLWPTKLVALVLLFAWALMSSRKQQARVWMLCGVYALVVIWNIALAITH